MKIGFTGTRHGLSTAQRDALAKLLGDLSPTEAHHGDCVGADAAFDAIARSVAAKPTIVIHPPLVTTLQALSARGGDIVRMAAEYLTRNRQIVNECDRLLACPFESVEQQRGGTWSTIRYARKIGRPVTVVLRDGSILG